MGEGYVLSHVAIARRPAAARGATRATAPGSTRGRSWPVPRSSRTASVDVGTERNRSRTPALDGGYRGPRLRLVGGVHDDHVQAVARQLFDHAAADPTRATRHNRDPGLGLGTSIGSHRSSPFSQGEPGCPAPAAGPQPSPSSLHPRPPNTSVGFLLGF
jgi:hypothetical protein